MATTASDATVQQGFDGRWWVTYPVREDGTGGVHLPISLEQARRLIANGARLNDSSL